jgi:hypothetical protein
MLKKVHFLQGLALKKISIKNARKNDRFFTQGLALKNLLKLVDLFWWGKSQRIGINFKYMKKYIAEMGESG